MMQLIALTGWGQERDHLKRKAAGFDWHLTHPFDMDALFAVLMNRPFPKTDSPNCART
jgi:hypothetical protein